MPFKVETNRDGQIVMSPTHNRHSQYQSKVFILLDGLMQDGEVSMEYATETSDGVKVPDVVWMSAEFFSRHRDDATCTESPEIVVEVFSDSNTRPEMRGKRQLFFERNAREFWLVESDGRVRFYTAVDEEVPRSLLCPEFPARIEPGLAR